MNNKMNGEISVDFKSIEARWRPYWQEIDLYKTGDDSEKPNIYILDYFPYPSGEGLSVGHCRNYVPTCVSSRFYRKRGYNVLHPMGWDAFGLPAENYAIKHNIHPSESSAKFSATYRRQMKLIECSYDWSREFTSTDPDYYRWTQWFFLLLHKRGLAYRAEGSQWFCPHDHTILANEQVEDGLCWRCGTPVVRKKLEQWYFKITEYADRLLDDLQTIDWPESIKAAQRNWIGRSVGAEIRFQVDGSQKEIRIFTTRPDTLYGVTFIALAPEHPMILDLCAADRAAVVDTYVQASMRRTEIDRSADKGQKTGVFSGAHVVHPLNGTLIPIWIADYVLPSYGTGAIMGVPAHDERDYEFAQSNNLPIVRVIRPDKEVDEPIYTGHGVMVKSGPYNGEFSLLAGEAMLERLQSRGLAHKTVSYKMRDWLISRQRYWGAPIPIVHCPKCGVVPVPEADLPVRLPDIADFKPSEDGRSPLARAETWVNTQCPNCHGPARRETDTMDGFACSSWYFLRFASPHYQEGPFEEASMRRWMPVDSYVGGTEHAVMHLLYSRFWTKIMYDAGLVPFTEPFSSLRNQGMMLSADDGRRMSKSKGNIVTPDEVVAKHGTDALRMYVLFLGPFEADSTWDERGIKGVRRFLNRYWRLANDAPTGISSGKSFDLRAFELEKRHVIEKVTTDIERFRFNTAVAALMSYLNFLIKARDNGLSKDQWHSALTTLTLLLCPIAPFITEEVWQTILGHDESVHLQPWPTIDEDQVRKEQITIVVQVNGRVRDRMKVAEGVDNEILQTRALSRSAVQSHINGKEIRNIVVVPDRLINIVV